MKKTVLATSLLAASFGVFANDLSPAVSVAIGSNEYTHIKAGLVKPNPLENTTSMYYLSTKTIGNTSWPGDAKYATYRLGAEVTGMLGERSSILNFYVYSNDTDLAFFNKEGVGIGFGVTGDSEKLQPYLYGEFNFEFLSTDWQKVDLEYNLQSGIDYSFNKHFGVGVFVEHQGYSASSLFNDTYTSAGLKLKLKM